MDDETKFSMALELPTELSLPTFLSAKHAYKNNW